MPPPETATPARPSPPAPKPDAASSLPTSADPAEAPSALKANALGPTALFFCIATAAAPLTALAFNVPVITSGAGYAVPAAFILGLVALLVFAVGYVEMAKRVTSASGFYAFVSQGFGRVAGLGSAGVVALSYTLLVAALAGVFAYFASTTIDSWFGVSIPVWVLLFGLLIVNTLFAWFDVEITAKVLGAFFVAEVVGITIFAIVTLAQGGDSGLSASPLNPLDVFDNSQAIAVFGAAAPGIALFGAFWSWVGFEMAPNYGEEVRDAPRVSGRAMFITLLALGAIYVIASYAFVTGWGVGGVAKGVESQFNGDTASAFYPLTDRFFGSSLTTAFQGLIVTSSFACQLAFFNTASRYYFALGREGILPKALGRTHKRHRTPHVASIVVAAVVAVYILGFQLDDSSLEASLLKLGTWTPLVGVLGILVVQALVSFAIVRYFLTTGREHFHPVKTLIAPIVGGLLMIGSAYLLVDNRATLAGAEGVPFIQAVPWVVLAIFLVGVVAALWFRWRDSARYQAVGRFVREEA